MTGHILPGPRDAQCPAALCTEQVDPDMLMCPRHWYQVPKPLPPRRMDGLAPRRLR